MVNIPLNNKLKTKVLTIPVKSCIIKITERQIKNFLREVGE